VYGTGSEIVMETDVVRHCAAVSHAEEAQESGKGTSKTKTKCFFCVVAVEAVHGRANGR
jgi:hypothetical protein